jgi:hypothetical protein
MTAVFSKRANFEQRNLYPMRCPSLIHGTPKQRDAIRARDESNRRRQQALPNVGRTLTLPATGWIIPRIAL